MISEESAEHYGWGSGCDGWHLVTQQGLSVIQERMPPGTSEARHAHARASQFFFVLAGTLVFELDGHEATLRAMQGIEVPPGSPHQVRNESGLDAEFLVISQPPSHGDRIPR